MTKRRFTFALIVFWLVLQIAVPFFRKFGVFPFQYRYATFSWAMYSKPALHYEISLFRKNKRGQKEPIPNLEKLVCGYSSLGRAVQREYYRPAAEIKEDFIRLLKYIAAQEKPGFQYGISLRWTRPVDAQEPAFWEYTVSGINS